MTTRLSFHDKEGDFLVYNGQMADGEEAKVKISLVEGQYGDDSEKLKWSYSVEKDGLHLGSGEGLLGKAATLAAAANLLEDYRSTQPMESVNSLDASIARGREILESLNESKAFDEMNNLRAASQEKQLGRDRFDLGARHNLYTHVDHKHPNTDIDVPCDAMCDTAEIPLSNEGDTPMLFSINPRTVARRGGKAAWFSTKLAALLLVGYTLGFKAHESGVGPAPGSLWGGVQTVATSPFGIEVWTGDWYQTKVGPTGNDGIVEVTNPDGTTSYFDPSTGSRDIKIMFARTHRGLFGNLLRTETKSDPGWGEAGRPGGEEIVAPSTRG